MDRSTLYTERGRWTYPTILMDEIISEMKSFYEEYNKTKKGVYKIKRFKNEPAFIPLREYITNKSKFEDCLLLKKLDTF